ncbi:hypothetical protein FHU10_5168 [Serratia fonticola]|uniref:UPF0319 protein FHU10_5168 n=1 Tax=Serratia fonticola TaxID=47917 RepID=A0A542BN16_SERFO|nr:DUF2057 family protein [Serratia fonticola]TQI79982.1 hypothetical protein FHU09_2536 [Serratia fonticola]TQI97992.1 hypothetical protein FHU11_3510 [Serratia fonticola]TVZ72487.1 hypothetical protein FHU10_5168 [Serratia fonticola]
MKFGLVVAGLLGLSLSVSAAATTLRLSPDIELMVVDGKKMTGSLLKGADSLELDGGQHQLLFKVTKSIHKDPRTQVLYTSAPQIVVFNSQDVSMVTIVLPRIENVRDSLHFDEAMDYKLVDNNGQALVMKNDVLSLKGMSDDSDLEKIIADYNGQNRIASLPALAHLRASTFVAPPGNQVASSKVITLKGENVPEQMLQYWFLRADAETQKRFIHWAGKHPNR